MVLIERKKKSHANIMFSERLSHAIDPLLDDYVVSQMVF